MALRIDHIGSTAVPGLAAKPVLDIQISVTSFDPLEGFSAPLEALGYAYRADPCEWRLFCDGVLAPETGRPAY
jgi:GrpB-like predicted nucleotidyltransferase (UPF0157 family)